MYGIADYGAFVLAILVFLAIPGPGNLALITATGHGGVRAGMAAACGVVAADQVLMWAAVAGVAALLATHPWAFATVQWLGAAYLAWMGFRMVTAKPGDAPVLRIEPRHFMAMKDLAVLLEDLDEHERALEVLRRLQVVDPHFDGLDEAIEAIVAGSHGRDI